MTGFVITVLEFVAQRTQYFFLAGIIIPAVLLLIFAVYEIDRVAHSKRRKRMAEVIDRWRRLKKFKKHQPKHKIPLLWRVTYLRKRLKKS